MNNIQQTLTQITGIAAVIMTVFAIFLTFFVWKASTKMFNKIGAQIVATVYSSASSWGLPIVLWIAFFFLNHKW